MARDLNFGIAHVVVGGKLSWGLLAGGADE